MVEMEMEWTGPPISDQMSFCAGKSVRKVEEEGQPCLFTPTVRDTCWFFIGQITRIILTVGNGTVAHAITMDNDG